MTSSSIPPFSGLVEFAPGFQSRPDIRYVLFDFDGTLSLIRQGWPEVMVPMFVEMLPQRSDESEADLERLAYDDIMRLNGKQTIFQMIQLAQRVQERGGNPRKPQWYKHEYLRRLDQRIGKRIEGLQSGRIGPDDLMVHGSRQMLDQLSARGFTLYLASGTDEPFVKAEAELLDVARYFGPHIYGAQENYQNFSKKMVIDRILLENKISGQQLLAFGDGYVEIENTKAVGGLAVAVASDEANNGSGRIDPWKRQRLVGVGADVVIPDYHDAKALLDRLTGEPSPSRNEGAAPIDLRQIRVYPLAERKSLTSVEEILVDPAAAPSPLDAAALAALADLAGRIRNARQRGAAVMLIYGAHLLRNGAARILDSLMAGGWLTHLATNGAGTIHDWEYAWLGRSTESVRDGVAHGCFGTWDETGRNIHVALLMAGVDELGYGEALGQFIAEDGVTLAQPADLEEAIRLQPAHPLTAARAELLAAIHEHGLPAGRYAVAHRWKEASILAAAYRHGVPLSVHPGIGYDIIATHPMFNGAAIGRAAQRDFSHFTTAVENLDGGVVLSVGSAIMGPQVFEKSLSCVNNLRLQSGRPIVAGHTICVVDLQDGGGWDWTTGEPPKSNPAYYLRFCKSYSRMGGTMQYLQCDNLAFVHHLHHLLTG